MTPERRRNLLRLPVVVLLRIPLLLPFYILERIGKGAEAFGQWLAHHLPGFETEPRRKRQWKEKAPLPAGVEDSTRMRERIQAALNVASRQTGDQDRA